jgi:hypothetical protein
LKIDARFIFELRVCLPAQQSDRSTVVWLSLPPGHTIFGDRPTERDQAWPNARTASAPRQAN